MSGSLVLRLPSESVNTMRMYFKENASFTAYVYSDVPLTAAVFEYELPSSDSCISQSAASQSVIQPSSILPVLVSYSPKSRINASSVSGFCSGSSDSVPIAAAALLPYPALILRPLIITLSAIITILLRLRLSDFNVTAPSGAYIRPPSPALPH